MPVLTADGISLVLDVAGPRLPRIRHFGTDPGPLDADLLDVLIPLAGDLPLLPSAADNWFGRPALSGHRQGVSMPVRWTLDEPVTVESGEGGRVLASGTDAEAGLRVVSELELDRFGVLRMRHALTNLGPLPFTVDGLICVLPIPSGDAEVLDFSGRWSKEKQPQRAALDLGVWSREGRRGRTGHDGTGLLVVGEVGFGFRHGALHAVHTAWSGGTVHYAERLPEGQSVLGGGELLSSGEIQLGEGESYVTPWVYFVSSADGLDTASARLQRHLRAHSPRTRTARPVTLNNWEATYFDHGLDRLLELASLAADVGAERFVLDDGWFRGRRTDRAGLGDWFVDEGVWPHGLHPLADHVRSLGLEFGLWFEPEMVNPDSDLAREHPEWILGQLGRWPAESRFQQTLDVANPDVFDYLLGRIDALIGEYQLAYLKWDHNRDIAEPVHGGILGVHRQTGAVYRLMDELRRRHAGLEIESCASGGARVDYGILARTDRVWTSDCNDALERQQIQRWTGVLVPPEMLGSHVGSPADHITGRKLSLPFRCGTALFGHMGIEWDITTAGVEELAELREWIALHKRLRPLLHGGTTVRLDHPDPSAYVHGVVAPARDHAVFAYVQLTARAAEAPPAFRLAGLDPSRDYQVSVIGPETALAGVVLPRWAEKPFTVAGSVLTEVGLPAPGLRPAGLLLVEIEAARAASG
jgi:alpha-galactosidase